MRKLTIRDRTITDESDAYVVAELSHNHNGSQDIARQMIRVAAECGADAVNQAELEHWASVGTRVIDTQAVDQVIDEQVRRVRKPRNVQQPH